MLELTIEWILVILLILASFGVIISHKPVYACLSFFLALLILAAIYQELSAQFIAVIQILVYGGAILVLFMFIIVLFQDAHRQILHHEAKSSSVFLLTSAGAFLATLLFLGIKLINFSYEQKELSPEYGTAESLGKELYLHFIFPFEALTLLFLLAVVGALYIGRKEV
jgi:NADH-quinone oxidoreductase subunit J